jgi:hypothetical protein
VWVPTPIEAQASRREVRKRVALAASKLIRIPHTGLLMTSDVAGARPLSPGSGEGRPRSTPRGDEESGRPIKRRVAGPSAHDRGAVTLGGVRVQCDLHELGRVRLELDVWLARSLRRYAARNCSIENTVRRDSR